MIYLSVDFFGFILFEILFFSFLNLQLQLFNYLFSQIWGSFNHYSLKCIFSSTLHCGITMTQVLGLLLQLHMFPIFCAVYFYQSVSSPLSGLSNFYCSSLKSPHSFLCPLNSVVDSICFYFSYFFISSKTSIWFFFIFSIYLLRLSISLLSIFFFYLFKHARNFSLKQFYGGFFKILAR